MFWTIKHTEKFPRHHRYSLGIAIENRLQKLLELLLRAKYSREKTEVLNEANSEPQQQPRQPEQQQRVSCCPALSVDIDNQARNRTVYGLSERGFGSLGSIPELWVSEVCCRSRIYAVRPGGAGRFYTERPIWLAFREEKIAGLCLYGRCFQP
jgi:hypothetical protein